MIEEEDALYCLVNLVGIRVAEDGGKAPESGLYVTSLPDITLTEVARISKETEEDEDDQVDAVWADVETRGILKFRTLFISEMNKCYKVSKRDLAECVICENTLLLATSLWYLLGAELMWERINSNRLNRYTTIDKAKAKVLRGEFMELFHAELATAVAGIDVFTSECFETDCLEDNSMIHIVEPIM